MSYNISAWKQVKINDFRIPLDVLNEADGMGFDKTPSCTEVIFNSGPSIQGYFNSADEFVVKDLLITGKWSDVVYETIFLNNAGALIGELSAVVVWEGGDTIEQITLENGIFTEDELFHE